MGRRQTMMEKYKIQMKAYRKKRMKADSTPFLSPEDTIYVMDSLNPEKRIKATIKKTATRNQRLVIESLACPECGNDMFWDGKWEAFICTKHGKRAIYEIAP
jgi:tRNA(Ile2) C34 agmatinyltransferase TiaS